MNGLAIAILLALVPGQTPTMPGGQAQSSAPPKLHVVAAHASNQGNSPAQIDEKLASVKKVLLSLPFDTYGPVVDEEVEAPPGEETLVPINGIYSLYITPQGQDQSGALNLNARISMLNGDSADEEYIDAIYTQARLAQGMPLVFRGLDLNVGELVVILDMAGGGDQQGESQQEQSDQQEKEQDDKKQDQQSSSDNQDQQDEQEQQPQQQQQSAGESSEDSPELDNIESLLQSLEETDRKEQEDQQKKRAGIRVRGDWW